MRTSDASEPPPLPEILESRRERGLAGGLALLISLIFLVAALLDPYDEAGRPLSSGTHRQLGLPACTLRSLTGIGCPSCGMTTSFSLLMHGDPAAAWRANWAGCLVAAMALVSTAWFIAVAAGLPPGRLTADEAIKLFVCTGGALAMIRWLVILVSDHLYKCLLSRICG